MSKLRLILAFVLFAPAARAVTPEELALAETLFRDAKQAMNEGRYADACPKLAESQRLDPAGGTLLSLALCHEAEGRTASAWAELSDTIAYAKRDGRTDRETIAREHLAAVTPRLRKIRFVVAEPNAKVQVTRDDVEIGRAAWSVAAPVDPGNHVIDAKAEGFESWRTTVPAPAEGATAVIEIPALRPLPVSAPKPAPVADTEARPPLRYAAYGAGAAAIVGLGLGVGFALSAKSARDDANTICPQTACTDAAAVRSSESAARSADIATIAFVAGGVAAATAVVLYVLSSPSGRARARAPRALFTF